MKLENYVTEETILRQLCRMRIKLARSNHDHLYVRRLLENRKISSFRDAISHLLPPRKSWSQFRRRFRFNAADPNLASLLYAARSGLASTPQALWVIEFRRFVAEVQERVLAATSFSVASPTIGWELKENHKYRALCRFTLIDNVVVGIVDAYLRYLLDPAFEDSSYAFRAAREGYMPTHHHAFNSVYDLRRRNLGRDLFVAECDIQGFYDCVDHQVAMDSLLRVAANVRRLKPDHDLDTRAIKVFQAYLDCFNYPENVLKNATPLLRQEEKDLDAYFGWPGEALKQHHADPLKAKIGVPQGGALSCIIANLVLDKADKEILKVQRKSGSPLHYLRYCDDMILIADKRRGCAKAFQAYCSVLQELKLPFHEPEQVVVYSNEIWDFKSKVPYCWTGRKFFNCVPWVQFVGYQVRYDGLVRIKKKSFQKHIEGLTSTTDNLVFPLRKCTKTFSEAMDRRISGSEPNAPFKFIRATKGQLVASFRGKLTSIGVGRINPNRGPSGPRTLCWTSGYKALDGKPFVPTFLKRFDRERERQIRRVTRTPAPYATPTFLDRMKWKLKRRKIQSHARGFRASYTAQFTNAGGLELIQNPYRARWWERLITEPVYRHFRKKWSANKGRSWTIVSWIYKNL